MPSFQLYREMLPTGALRLRSPTQLVLLLVLIAGLNTGLFAQSPLRITLLSDLETATTPSLDALIADELAALLGSRYDLTLDIVYTGGRTADIRTATDQAYAVSDFVVGSGLGTSSALMNLTEYPKSTIAAVVLNKGEVAGAGQVGETSGTGIPNFTFVQSPFDIGRDLRALKAMTDFGRLTVLTTATLRPALAPVIQEALSTPVDYVTATGTVTEILRQIPRETKAVYLTPLETTLPYPQQKILLDSLTARGAATFGLLDKPLLELGALAAHSSSENISKLPRRVALDVLRILDGIPAAELSTELSAATSGLVINMATARAAGVYPSWETMQTAILLNPNDLPDARELTLRGAVLEGLANNLGYQFSAYDVDIARSDLGIAKSDLLPQAEIATTLTHLDAQTIASSFGQQGSLNWTAKGTVNQVILSEPAFANVAINRLLLEGQEAALEVAQLDVVLDVATAYLNTVQAKVFADLQNDNLAVTRANLDAASTKREAGAVGASDVYRWESELALNRIDVNNAQAQLAQSRYNLNQLLNRPINEEFTLPEFTGQDSLLGTIGQTIIPLLNSPRDLDRLANFLAAEAVRDLPTLDQLEAAINAQERQLLASRRSLYLPTIGIGGQYNYRIANYGTVPLPPELGFDFASEDRPRSTYNVALNASLPIFQGGRRKLQVERSRVATLQANTQRQDVQNQLLQRLYSDVESVVASYRNVQLARSAAETATKNFAIVEDLYLAGVTNITSLVDAQNVTLQSNINATNAGYQFVADFINLQRSTGSYQFLESDANQADFLRRFMEFK
ncbi:TolC family protein [Neolewinella antarctica]|uniref:Outer membrane protein TolC n=1 Tax=Neolewinella antarctica TaxID=442734 RepID=A0ABX0XAE1_9BACT|nr:TolC family protein [Neolewinella antarctica]NJC25904.1 outer membrane protein TolC [Neolewinella antarctica]